MTALDEEVAARDPVIRAEACLGDLRRQRGPAAGAGASAAALRERLETVRDELSSWLGDAAAAPGELAHGLRLLHELDDVRESAESAEVSQGLEALVAIHDGLRRLRELRSPEQLIEAAAKELCRSCGFSRAMISRVRGSLWVPEVLEIVDDCDPAADAFLDYVENAEIPLEHMLLETDLVRRRVPVLVADPAANARTWKEIVGVARSTSYVAAPIMPTRRVIGFLHADRFGQEEPVTVADRDNLWAFAEHFGLLFERAVLVERLEAQRSRLRDALAKATSGIDELCSAEIELARHERVREPASQPLSARDSGSRLDALLTAREREVLELLATGATNAVVADQLVVSEGTVKSHVKHILRKLRVSNRAEAVGRYLGMTRREQAASPR